MAIVDKLTYLQETKKQIKNAIIEKGVEVSDTDTFRSYADKIGEIKATEEITKLNVFAQSTEPNIKEGIWINTQAFAKQTKLADIPYSFFNGAVVKVGTDIYLFGGGSIFEETDCKKAYKYNTSSNTYTQLEDIPFNFILNFAVAIDEKIYLFDSSGLTTTIYIYNTTTNTYTQEINLSVTFDNKTAVVVDNYIYCFKYPYFFKYNIKTNEITELNGTGYAENYIAVAIEKDIYLFSMSVDKKVFKYNTLANTYTELNDSPYNFSNSSALAVGTDIYITDSKNKNKLFKYNALTDAYIEAPDVIYDFYGSLLAIDTDIYFFGGSNDKATAFKYDTTEWTEGISQYEYNNIEIATTLSDLANNSIYILSGEDYKTNILNNMTISFDTAFLYKDNTQQKYPVYYGDGTGWTLI